MSAAKWLNQELLRVLSPGCSARTEPAQRRNRTADWTWWGGEEGTEKLLQQ